MLKKALLHPTPPQARQDAPGTEGVISSRFEHPVLHSGITWASIPLMLLLNNPFFIHLLMKLLTSPLCNSFDRMG
jgi:hypothetical protein